MNIFNLNKGGIIIAQVLTTMLNYILWAVVLKPLGLADTVASSANSLSSIGFNSQFHSAREIASTASKTSMTYGIAKTLVYLLTTGLFILLLTKNKAYKKLSMGNAVLGCSILALCVDFLNMTILPSFVFYSLALVLIFASKEVEEKAKSQIL